MKNTAKKTASKVSNVLKVQSENYSLIDGTFDYDDAREILLTLYQAKINFHKLKAWSKSERGEIGIDEHTARVLELEMARDQIKDKLKGKMDVNGKVKIKCAVSVEFH
jgi:hypothetical protein